MITAGIDAGLEATKIVIVKDGAIIGKSIGASGGAGREEAIKALFAEALQDAGIAASELEKTIATGAGKFDAAFANETVTEPIADAKAAAHYLAEAAFVVDIGADQVRVISIGENGSAAAIALNQKCSAGIGMLLKYLARRFEIDFDEIAAHCADKPSNCLVNDGCIVFAELDALELLNQNVPKEEVFCAIIEAMAVRANMVLNDKTPPAQDTTVLIGGVARNLAFVRALKARSGIDFIVPEDAEYGCALGAALIAAA